MTMCSMPPCRKPAVTNRQVLVPDKDGVGIFVTCLSQASVQLAGDVNDDVDQYDHRRGELSGGNQARDGAGVALVYNARRHFLIAIGANTIAGGDESPALRAHSTFVQSRFFLKPRVSLCARFWHALSQTAGGHCGGSAEYLRKPTRARASRVRGRVACSIQKCESMGRRPRRAISGVR